MIIQEATAMDVRKNLGDVLNSVQYRHDSVVITKGGKPVAAVVDMELFQRIRLLKSEFDRLTNDMAEVFSKDKPEIVEAVVAEAVKKVRKKK